MTNEEKKGGCGCCDNGCDCGCKCASGEKCTCPPNCECGCNKK